MAAGGISGLAIVMNYLVPQIPVGLFMLIVNVILFIVGIAFIGKGFGVKTIYSSIALSSMIWILESYFPITEPLAGDMFIELIFGMLVIGAGMAIVFLNNASTGGTDIIAKILNKYLHVNIGMGVLIAVFHYPCSNLCFRNQDWFICSIRVIINGFVIDNFIEGIEVNKQVTIITTKVNEINSFIINVLGRGATIYTARGAYTNEPKDIIIVVLERRVHQTKEFYKRN